ncbi:MAG: Fis family transcriptional regulator [Pseudonocardia sp. SCN 72-86]|nr:MAG: Fis family transcriptional regulator [Pseudonocardia sp. SCN 72-86]
MAEMSDRRLLLASARADLLDGTDLLDARSPAHPGVPDHVAASWRRSVAGGVHPDGVESPYFEELDYGSRLVRCAQPVIEQLSEQIADVPMCVALTDNRARILVRRDSSHGIGRILDRVSFAKGFGYEEGDVGTNGVGTVLEFGESVHIVGAEHFVDTLQSFACAGAPVRDPFTGRIEGVLDISCLSDHSTPIMHSLVRSAARRIEHNLVLDRDQAQQALFDVYSRVDSRTRDAVVAVGARFVVANTAMRTLLAAPDQEALHDQVRFMTQRHATVDHELDLPSGVRVRLRGSTVTLGDDVAGMVCLVTLLREAGSAEPILRPATALPGRAAAGSSSPAWCAAASTVRRAVRAGETVLVLGEPGSGRFTVLASARPETCVRRIEAADVVSDPDAVARSLTTAGPDVTHVLCNIDQLPEQTADDLVERLEGLGRPVALLGATSAADDRTPRQPLLALFRQSATLPPLRHRTADLPVLTRELLRDLAPHRELQLSPEAFRVLGRHRWPGNIRELRDVLADAVARRPVGVIEAGDLPAHCQSSSRSTLRQVDRIERDAIVDALRQARGNRKAAAAALGLARSTLYRKIRHYGITD